MREHIDVFVNDWSNAEQRSVARVSLRWGRVHIRGEERWKDILGTRPAVDIIGGREYFADTEPHAFYALLPECLRGSYVGATKPHTNKDCPFRDGPVPFGYVDLRKES